MSPEQASGEVVDHRTDIGSLGATLYEMVAGKAPFGGDYEQAVIYSILNTDPEPLTALRTGVPMELERIVSKCLAKEAGRRYSTTADLIVDLENLDVSVSGASRSAVSTSRIAAARPPRSVLRWWVPAAGALIAGLLLGWWLFGSAGSRPAEQAIMRFSAGIIDLPVGGYPVISDDGNWIAAFAGHGTGDDEPVLQVRSLESREVIQMQPASPTGYMRFSPDGRSIVIPTASGLQLWPMDGGSPQLVTPQENILWFTWTGERAVLYTGMMDSVLYEVAGPNDKPKVYDPDEPLYIGFPYQIPDSDILL